MPSENDLWKGVLMYLSNLYPKPEFIHETPDVRYSFGNRVNAHLVVPASDAAVLAPVLERMKALWNNFCKTASTLDIQVELSSKKGCCFSIGTPVSESTEIPAHYEILADERGILLTAVDTAALMNGFTTLVQLICPVNLDEGREEFYITGAKISDQPAIGFRSVHFCIFPDSALSTIEKAIHMAGFMKFTHIVLEFWGTLQYETIPELAWKGHSFTKKEIHTLVDLARSYGMEVIPMVNHFGHATQSRSCYGRHTILNANPRRAKLFEPDGWTWCLSNPDTYKLLSDMRAELIDLCGSGSYFHLGFDEAYSFATCDKCRKRVPAELLAEYINRLTEDLAVSGRRPIIWHDELIRRDDFVNEIPDSVVANGQSHNTDTALALLDRRVIIADWQYEYRHTGIGGHINPTASYFQTMGFDTILCPWDAMQNVRVLCEDAQILSAYGVMLTTWHHLPAYLPKFLNAGEYAWRANGSYTNVPITETAAILRTVYPTNGEYLCSGWNSFEVDG